MALSCYLLTYFIAYSLIPPKKGDVMLLAIVVLATVLAVLVFLVYKFWKQSIDCRSQLQRYSGIADLDAAISAAKVQVEQTKQQAQQAALEDKQRRELLDGQYKQALTKYQELQHEVSLLEENLDDISFGLYKPHFAFQTSVEYKNALLALRDKMKQLIKGGGAASCPNNWTVNGSRQEGAKMIRQTTKVILRAFNGECDAAAANVSYNNVKKMEERLAKSFEAINKLGETMNLSITNAYLQLRLDETHLINEYETKKYEEKQEEHARREKMRDAEKAQREIEQAQQEAEAQEATYQKLLEKARQEAAEATGTKLQELTTKVSEFSAKLDEARQKKERAIARAQLTKSGFVYVISNIGAFGEGVVKIGMTRRMEPMERIMELSGAAVPFPFDLHVMLYSDDAPALECALHQLLDGRRLNLVNTRKEFFQGVNLAEIKGFVQERGLSAQFIEQAEAREYRETRVRREGQHASGDNKRMLPKFADSPFAIAGTA
ncbi:MAG TPA: DUF4041 domain-containing protein [Nitrososphaera sp.]|nr:DUF4041 domain-containing protein [Nitrososphaera sp.]